MLTAFALQSPSFGIGNGWEMGRDSKGRGVWGFFHFFFKIIFWCADRMRRDFVNLQMQVILYVRMPERLKGPVCKTGIRRFESDFSLKIARASERIGSLCY